MGWRGRRPDRPGVIRRTGRWSAGLRAGPGPARGRPDPARPTRRAAAAGSWWGRALGGAGLAGRLAGGGCRVAGDRVQDRRHVGGAVRGSGLRLSGGRIGVRRRGWPPGAGWRLPGRGTGLAAGRCIGVHSGARLHGRAASYCASSENRAGGAAQRGGRGSRGVVAGDQAARGQASAAAVLASTMAARSPRAPRSGRPGGDRAASHRPGRVSPGCRAG